MKKKGKFRLVVGMGNDYNGYAHHPTKREAQYDNGLLGVFDGVGRWKTLEEKGYHL